MCYFCWWYLGYNVEQQTIIMNQVYSIFLFCVYTNNEVLFELDAKLEVDWFNGKTSLAPIDDFILDSKFLLSQAEQLILVLKISRYIHYKSFLFDQIHIHLISI